jgi:hypothetical protein
MICLEEKESFVIFSCKHKTCNECFPLLIMYSTPCPICQQPITIVSTPSHCMEYCKIISGITIISLLIFYISNFAYKK